MSPSHPRRGSSAPSEDDSSQRLSERIGWVLMLVQFALLYLVIERFKIETAPFRGIFALGLAGFALHRWLPARLRMPFFLALSIAGIGLVFGWDRGTWRFAAALERGGWLLGIGAALVALCHVPVAFVWRVLMLLLAGAGLAALRTSDAELPVPPAIWPILASMFMFRLIVYLYDLRHSPAPLSWTRSASYFLMLPNVCFPLFPVVDYKQFCRSYAERPSLTGQQVGLRWMLRGVVHLILYRLVYYHFYLDASQVTTGAELGRFLITNLLLYLRVSGQFHLAVGLLHMFGFNLPETNHRYFLASSFADYWRRVNIYWRDFIMKIVYYPAVFRLRRLGTESAMVSAILIAFVATWALHAYQWFWLRGSFPIVAQDIAFWATLAVLVAINSLREARHGRRRSLGTRQPTARERAGRALKTAGTFLTICLLWSLWSAPSLADWFDLMSLADLSTLAWLGLAVALVMLASLLPDPPRRATQPSGAGASLSSRLVAIGRPALACLIPAFALFLVQTGRFHALLDDGTRGLLHSLHAETKPSEGDVAMLERGYYEELIDVGLLNSPLSEVFMKRPAGWLRLDQSAAVQPTGDYRFTSLRPSAETVVNGTLYRTNRWGMRDGDYEVEKAPGTFRVALLGASYPMGWSIEQEGIFEALVEERLNAEAAGGDFPRVEILNFSVNGYSPICQVLVLEREALRFSPDAVFYVAHHADPFWTINRFARAVREGVELPDAMLRAVAASAGVGLRTPQASAERRLQPRWPELVSWAYARIARTSREHAALPFWVYVPAIGERSESAENLARLRAIAEDAGFEIIDLSGAYGETGEEDLIVAPWDRHPNALGHRLLAERLFDAIRASRALAPLGKAIPLAGVEPEPSP